MSALMMRVKVIAISSEKIQSVFENVLLSDIKNKYRLIRVRMRVRMILGIVGKP